MYNFLLRVKKKIYYIYILHSIIHLHANTLVTSCLSFFLRYKSAMKYITIRAAMVPYTAAFSGSNLAQTAWKSILLGGT